MEKRENRNLTKIENRNLILNNRREWDVSEIITGFRKFNYIKREIANGPQQKA